MFIFRARGPSLEHSPYVMLLRIMTENGGIRWCFLARTTRPAAAALGNMSFLVYNMVFSFLFIALELMHLLPPCCTLVCIS